MSLWRKLLWRRDHKNTRWYWRIWWRINRINPEKDETSNESDKETSDQESIETISPKNDESTTDWYNKNKFNKILTTIHSKNFNHRNKIGKLKFKDINNLINNIKNNTISEALAKQKLDALNEIKKAEIKNKRLISSQKKLLKLFDELIETIFDNKSVSKIDDNVSVNESDNVSVNENYNVRVNENDNDNKNESESDNESENGDGQYYKIKQLNNWFKTIDETKSLEQRIKILKKEIF